MSATTTSTVTSAFPFRRQTRTGSDGTPRLTVQTRLWMWGWLLSFFIHNGEEALYIVRNGGLKEFGTFQTTAECLAGILFELMLGWLAILAATRAARPGRTMTLFGMLIWGWTLHGVMHLVDASSGHGYSFGSVTAAPAVIAYGGLMLTRLYREQLMNIRRLPLAVLGGAALGAVLVYGAHQYGSLLG